jgi:DNA-binding NarL/FixJ family response regulator
VTICVLVADDERLIRAGYRMILDAEPDVVVVGEAADGVEAVEMARRLRPDVVLMDVRMPRLDGIAATQAIMRLDAPPAVLVVTTFDLDEYVYRALRMGASGFLLKDAPEQQLTASIRAARDGVSLMSPAVTTRLVATYATGTTTRDSRLEMLTERETDILTQIALGRSNAEIARASAISETTVKTHVSRVLSKLGLTSRSQAVVVAYESGVVVAGQRRSRDS